MIKYQNYISVFCKFQELAKIVKFFFVKYKEALRLEVQVHILWQLLSLIGL